MSMVRAIMKIIDREGNVVASKSIFVRTDTRVEAACERIKRGYIQTSGEVRPVDLIKSMLKNNPAGKAQASPNKINGLHLDITFEQMVRELMTPTKSKSRSKSNSKTRFNSEENMTETIRG
ncbi:MAG: hypothetical protein V1728_06205 [Candidatus Micrarchaeota archaeon]